MSLRARLDAMRPEKTGATRTADPRPPDDFPARGRYRGYILFGLGSSLMLVVALEVLRVLQHVGAGAHSFAALLQSFEHPAYLAFHALAFVWLSWVALRFFALFPKTQPFRIGPFRRPPDALMVAGLWLLWLAVTAGATALLVGGLPCAHCS